jgi:archaemetzincin
MIIRPTFIYLAPLGDGVMEHLQGIAENIREQFGLEVKITENQGSPDYALHAVRKQYNSNLIIKRLLEICPQDAVKLLGVTNLDLFSPIFAYVFGEAQFRGKCAVVSSYRLRGNPNDGSAHGFLQLAHRLEKEVVHELGHTFGLAHCADPDCVMNYSVGVQSADRKFAFFCRACRETMIWHLATDLFLKV